MGISWMPFWEVMRWVVLERVRRAVPRRTSRYSVCISCQWRPVLKVDVEGIVRVVWVGGIVGLEGGARVMGEGCVVEGCRGKVNFKVFVVGLGVWTKGREGRVMVRDWRWEVWSRGILGVGWLRL